MFLQIHTLTSYPASLLNRDDAGLAKRIRFGDDYRLRVSSQCLKRHWRDYLLERVSLPDGDRTRYVFGRKIYDNLVKSDVAPDTAEAVTIALKEILIDSKDSKDDADEDNQTEGKKKAAKTEKKRRSRPHASHVSTGVLRRTGNFLPHVACQGVYSVYFRSE